MTATEEFRPDLLGPLLCDLAAEGRAAELPVRGISMHPWLREGDRVRVVAAAAPDVRVGDIVVRVQGTGPVVHRFVGWWRTRHGWRMLTKGDGAPRFDPPLAPAELVGRAVALLRDGQVRRLDGAGIRLRGRSRAAVSLAAGLIRETWDRAWCRSRPPAG
jgi:hypothetical protein